MNNEATLFNKKIIEYTILLEDLDQLLDALPIDLLGKMKVEIMELANLSSPNQAQKSSSSS